MGFRIGDGGGGRSVRREAEAHYNNKNPKLRIWGITNNIHVIASSIDFRAGAGSASRSHLPGVFD